MKTFTTYAEKKAKQFLNLLQGYTKGIRIIAVLTLLLTMGVGQVWGASYPLTVNYPYVYLDNSILGWDGCNVVVGHDSYSYGYLMTQIPNTKLFYKEIPANWGDAKGIVFIKGTSQWGEWKNQSLWDRTNGQTRTGYQWDNQYESMDYHKTYLCTSTGSNDLIISYQSSGYSALNSQQTIKSAVNGADDNSKATINITSYKMTGNGQVTEQTATLGTGAKDTYVSAARTATTTLTVGAVATGYQFDGWYAAKTGGTALSTSTTYTYYPTAATTVYARFSTIKYTVIYGVHSSGNGTLAAKVGSTSISSGNEVNYGSKVVFTATPSKGYQIEGWYSNSTCTTPIDNGTNDTYTVTITIGTNVYVKFKAQEYTITYKDQGGSNFSGTHESGHPTTHTYGTATTLKTASKTGYTFEGWYKESACTNKVTSLGATAYTANITLYAKWTANKYTVKFHANDGTNKTADQDFTYDIAQKLTANTFTRTGYNFAGWATSQNGAVKYTDQQSVSNLTSTNNGTVNLYAKWTANTYTVELNQEGATTVGTASVKATYGAAMPNIDIPARTGYTFLGYWTEKEGQGKQYYNANGSSANNWTETTVKTLYAHWIAKTYTITYTDQGTGWKYNRKPTSAKMGDKVVFDVTPTNGYDVAVTSNGPALGQNGNEYSFEMPAQNVAITVSATEKLTNVTLNVSQGSGSFTVDSDSYESGRTVQVGVTTSYTVKAIANTGYTFDRWTQSGNASASGNGNTVTLSGNGNGGTGRLNAYFTANVYTITFNKQEGTGGTDEVTVQYNNNNYSKNPVEAPKREGYAFGGYYSLAGGNGIQVVDENGKWITNATGYTNAEGKWVKADNVTLHAKWTESQVKHKVLVRYMCGDVVVKEAETIAVGEILPTSITAPAVTGYTFSEWKLGNGLVTENNLTAYTINLKTKSSGDYTLTANYIKYQYTLTFGVLGYGGSVSAIADGNEIASPAPLGQDSKVTLTATAKDGYVFHKWINSTGNEVSKANPYEHTMTESTTINAVFKNTRMLYLKPNDGWKGGHARFAAYFYRDGSGDTYWADMTSEFACDNSNGIYKVPIPDGTWTHVIFVRMNPSFNENRWNRDDDGDNKPVWNQTGNLRLPTNGNNLFELPTTGDYYWNGATTTWTKYTSTYEPVYLTYNVEVPAGTPNCYISGKMNGWSFTEMEKIDDTHYTITIQDACSNDEYKYCYGPSWGCQEVKKSDFTAINNRTHKNSDKVEAWIKYCLVGNNNIGWSWNDAYSFDIAGDMSHNFNANNYDIKVMSSTEKYYTHNEYPYNLHRSHTSVKIPHEGGENNQLILQADLTGTYKFHFDPVSKLLTIEFPEKGYRLKITMADGSGKVYTSNAVNNENETLSFFAPGANDPKLSGTITLEHKGETISSFTAPYITESGVYTAKLNSDRNGITEIALYNGNYYIRTDGASGGWGNYTDNGNKMTYFVPREEEKYSYYWVEALPRASRNESNGVVNVKACVANEYNDNLAVMLGGDKFTSDSDGNVKIIDPDEHHREKINVRFGYNPKTNHFERAMLTGSGNINTFLNIFDPLPEGYLYKTYKQETFETQLTAASQDNKFTDISNWVYERDIWVDVQEKEDVTVCLTAVSYNGARNSLFGFEDPEQTTPKQRTIVAKGSTPGPKKMRVIYDFKTNRMIMAWMPGEYDCTREEALIADVLFMRHENELVPQLTMTDPDGENGVTPQIKGIQTQFFALELENKGNQNYEEHYWITLPFNCIVGSISGVPGYMQTWGIQRYNGKKRAEKGWWKETETFWEWLGPDDVMEAGVGYVLSFDKSAATWNTFDVHEEDANGNISTTQKSLLRLYFPSTEKGFTFKSTNSFEKEYTNEPCTITTANRHLQDGNWKIIGPISYNSATADPTIKTGDNVWKPEADGDHVDVSGKWSEPMFRYKYTYDNSSETNRKTKWKYTPEDGEKSTYQAFYGYMVQFAGIIKWSEISQSVHPRLRARTYTDQVPTNITTCLELVDADNIQQDQTFVSLNVEGTTTYDLNKDLNKVFNNNFANIYTLSEGIPFAGNTLPMEKAIVPVGVRIATAGEYTFRMPDGTEGINVTLIDNQTGTQTDMLMSEYTITLDAGTIENRFYLVVDPDRTATSVENVGEEAKGEEAKGQIKKFLIDGKLFIRTADGIFDAKGQRM